MTNQLHILEARIDKIKKEIIELEYLRPGCLSKQYNTCGNPRCSCKKDPAHRHGPYYQLSYTRNGKSRTEYIKNSDIAVVKKQIKNHKKLQSLVNSWIDLSTQICQIKIKYKDL